MYNRTCIYLIGVCVQFLCSELRWAHRCLHHERGCEVFCILVEQQSGKKINIPVFDLTNSEVCRRISEVFNWNVKNSCKLTVVQIFIVFLISEFSDNAIIHTLRYIFCISSFPLCSFHLRFVIWFGIKLKCQHTPSTQNNFTIDRLDYIINPRRACAARVVTVLRLFVCLSVCLSVCYF